MASGDVLAQKGRPFVYYCLSSLDRAVLPANRLELRREYYPEKLYSERRRDYTCPAPVV